MPTWQKLKTLICFFFLFFIKEQNYVFGIVIVIVFIFLLLIHSLSRRRMPSVPFVQNCYFFSTFFFYCYKFLFVFVLCFLKQNTDYYVNERVKFVFHVVCFGACYIVVIVDVVVVVVAFFSWKTKVFISFLWKRVCEKPFYQLRKVPPTYMVNACCYSTYHFTCIVVALFVAPFCCLSIGKHAAFNEKRKTQAKTKKKKKKRKRKEISTQSSVKRFNTHVYSICCCCCYCYYCSHCCC